MKFAKPAVSERREHPRSRRRDISLTLMDPIGRILDEKPALVDISLGGVRIGTRFGGLAGESVHLRFELPGGQEAVGLGRIRWAASPDPSSARELGLEFVEFGWGGFGALQATLAPGAASSALRGEEPFYEMLDTALMAACVLVCLLVLRSLTPRSGGSLGVVHKLVTWESPRVRPEEDILRALRANVEGTEPTREGGRYP